jgi:hypothetical protein
MLESIAALIQLVRILLALEAYLFQRAQKDR